jgi:hypothetical protein
MLDTIKSETRQRATHVTVKLLQPLTGLPVAVIRAPTLEDLFDFGEPYDYGERDGAVFMVERIDVVRAYYERLVDNWEPLLQACLADGLRIKDAMLNLFIKDHLPALRQELAEQAALAERFDALIKREGECSQEQYDQLLEQLQTLSARVEGARKRLAATLATSTKAAATAVAEFDQA